MKRLAWVAALLLVPSVVVVRSGIPVTVVRPFLGFRAKTTKKTTKFVKILGVHLGDDFEDGTFDLTAAADFLAATVDAGGPGLGQRTHLRAYKLKAAKGSPKHQKQLAIVVQDDVGTSRTVNTTKPELLLVPTAVDPAVVPAVPDPDALDAFKCYRVAITKGTAKLPKGLRATVVDPFGTGSRVLAVKSLKHLCLPVDRDGTGIANPSPDLACYAVAPVKGQPKAIPRLALHLNGVLGPLTVDTGKESELCVPAERPVPTPTAGGSGQPTPTHTATAGGSPAPTPHSTSAPSDPSLVAPPLAKGVVSIPALSAAFLYTGADPIQTDVAPDTIAPQRAAILRGTVRTVAGAPIPGVTITIHGHPEFGSTRTRADGGFDLVVNGGGPLTVEYDKVGVIPLARQLDVPWQDYVQVPDAVMTALDPLVTAITFGPNAPAQTAEASVQSDADGTRHDLLFFAPGTSADLVFADGGTQPAGTLHIRATEFTVGATGPQAMPAALPPLSGYTYCTELSADEAIAAGAVSVAFSQPVVAYAENFLGFPVGLAVPLGFFDRQRAVWVAEPNGRIVKIVAVNGGVADVDTDGDDVADAGLGITLAERQSLGAVYAAGTSLWRMPTTHFSPQDGNNSLDTTGDTPPAANGAGPDQQDAVQQPCQNGGSIIECETQVLGEALAIVGTPYTLGYRSDRVPAQSAARTIRLSGPSVPPTLAAIGLHLSVAGQRFDQNFAASPNQETTFVWDRKDAYGRAVVGGQTLAVTIDYEYPAVYQEPGPFPEAFNQTGGTTLGLNPGRQHVVLSDHFTTTIGEGLTDARTLGLGGWTLDVHHVYDPVARVLHGGGGARRRAGSLARFVSTIDLPGKSVLFDIATGPDGAQYVALPHNDEIARVAPDGTVTIVAGTGVEGVGADGIAATAADLGDPTGVAVGADGSIYIAEQGNRRVRRVAPNGIITTIAGTGAAGTSGDGGPATQASFTNAERIAVGVDGSIYVDDGGTRIRRITTDGLIQTVAGTGGIGGLGDNGPATSATLNCAAVSAAADGGFYIADIFNHRVRRVLPNGTITTVVDYTSDLGQPVSVRPAPDGGLIIGLTYATARTPQIDVLKTDGTLVTVAGGGPTTLADGIPATQVNLAALLAVAVGPDGAIYLVRGGSDSHVVRVSPALPGFDGGNILIASSDGTQLYVFDADGRHRRTLHALTGAVVREFGYDAAGLLSTITEKTGGTDNVSTIQHDASGNPTAIVGPYGQVTSLGVDAHGFLASVTNPASETHTLVSTADGLLTSLTDPRGKTTTFTYDGDGRLLKDADPVGGSQTLARTAAGDQLTVTSTTQLGRITTHEVVDQTGNVQQRTVTEPDGAARQSVESIDAGTVHTTSADGTVADTVLGPDPRFGMQAPVVTTATLDFPTSPTVTIASTQAATLSAPHDPFSLTTATTTTTIAGHTTTTTYTAATKTFVATSAAGRTQTLTIDALGRLVSAQNGTLAPVHASYDARGRVATLTRGSGPSARTLTYGYDAQGRIESVTDPLSRTSHIAYDLAGRATIRTLPDGRVLALAHDAAGNVVTITPPGRSAHALAYSARNELLSVTPPAVPGTSAVAYAYDLDGAITGLTRAGASSITVAYDTKGRPVTRTQSLGGPPVIDSFAYDAAGRLVSASAASGAVLGYAYDGFLSTGETISGPVAGAITRTFDAAGRLASQTLTGTATIAYGYDADGYLTSAGDLGLTRDAQNGLPTAHALGVVSDSVGYDGFGALASVAATANGNPLYAATYTRDALDRIVAKSETIGGVTTAYTYAFDLAGQLTTVTKNGNPAESYVYDDNGNRTDATVGGVHVAATTDAQDRLTQYGTTSFTYDAAGDLATATVGTDVTTYDYDALGDLLSATLPGGTVVSYVVDAQERRVGKRIDGTLVQGLVWDDVLRPIAELNGAGTVVSRFVYVGGVVPAYLVKGGVAFRLLTDSNGSVRLVVNAATGAVVQRLDYDSFGRVTQDTNPGFQPFGFAGGLYDPDTGLVRFGLRDYDARTGRFTIKDPSQFHGNDPNLYRYALNDPLDFTDPTGLDWFDTFTGFFDTFNADIQMASNPVLTVQVLVDSLIHLGIAELGVDPGPTMYENMFIHPTTADRTSGDYQDGAFYGNCVGAALGIAEVAAGGIAAGANALDQAAVRAAADEVAEQAAQRAARKAAQAGERAIDKATRQTPRVTVQAAENGAGNVQRGRSAMGGWSGR